MGAKLNAFAHAVENLFGGNKPAFDAVTHAQPASRAPAPRIPTRAEVAYQKVGKDYNNPFGSAKNSYLNWTDGAGNPIGGSSPSVSSGSPVATPVSDQYDYYNAKLASIYKMNAETAYREALSNTAYQRAVEDLKAAGLNPVLAAGKVSGADSFYGTLDVPVTDDGFSSGGYSGGRSYSGASSGKSGLQKALKDYNVRSGVSSVVSGITMAATKNFQAGAAAYYFSNAILNAVAKR